MFRRPACLGRAREPADKKAQALLAYLGIRPGQSHPRDKLAALLWGEKSDEPARGGLRHALVALRRALVGVNPPALRIEGQTLSLDPAAVEVDVVTFERGVADGAPHALEHVAELYRGDLLLGFNVKSCGTKREKTVSAPRRAPCAERETGYSGQPQTGRPPTAA